MGSNNDINYNYSGVVLITTLHRVVGSNNDINYNFSGVVLITTLHRVVKKIKSVTKITTYDFSHFTNEKETGPSKVSQ